jgi:hypothetical protein
MCMACKATVSGAGERRLTLVSAATSSSKTLLPSSWLSAAQCTAMQRPTTMDGWVHVRCLKPGE